MKKAPLSVTQRIEERKKNHSFRSLMDAHDLVDFYSNDYLGLAKWNSQELGESGSTGSRLISGNFTATEQLETELAVFFGQESALLFNSGYDANLGLFSSLPGRDDTVIYDELVHASIRDGIRLGNAKSFSFRHNDLTELEDKLVRAKGEKYVVVESIYSMDGDAADLKEIARICAKHQAFLIVDEAHAGGIFGPQGKGLVTQAGLDEQIFAKIITFGKAYGGHGAVVLGSSALHDFLVNFARSFIYTTALPPISQDRIRKVVFKCAEMDADRKKLTKNIQFFRSRFTGGALPLIDSQSAIQSLIISGNEQAKELAQKVQDHGFAVKAILYPTVPVGKERLRFCLHSYNTEKEINQLALIIHG